MIDLLKKFSKETGIKVNFTKQPFNRSLESVKNGNHNAILAPSKNEGKGLKFPKVPIGIQKVCFYKLKTNSWMFQDSSSFNNDLIFIRPAGLSLGNLEKYILENKEKFPTISSANESKRLTTMLLRKRVDGIMFLESTADDYLRKNNLQDQIVNAGCFIEELLYLAFTPNTKRNNSIMEKFDKFLDKEKKSKVLDKLIKSYHLKKWY
jgi:ABC-type amino acid transport substrate-binding protein